MTVIITSRKITTTTASRHTPEDKRTSSLSREACKKQRVKDNMKGIKVLTAFIERIGTKAKHTVSEETANSLSTFFFANKISRNLLVNSLSVIVV